MIGAACLLSSRTSVGVGSRQQPLLPLSLEGAGRRDAAQLECSRHMGMPAGSGSRTRSPASESLKPKRGSRTRSPAPRQRPVLRERGGAGSTSGNAPARIAHGVDNRADLAAGTHSTLYCVSVCVAYAASSVAITFANKIVLSTYDFRFEMTLLLSQLVLGTLAMTGLFAVGVCERPPLDATTLRKSVPLAWWFFVYVISGLGSLRSLTVPTWSALRRLTSIFILVLDYHLDCKVAPTGIWLSVLVMLLGGLIAAAGDFEGSIRGHVHVCINCAASALYLRAINTLRRSAGVSEVGALYLTNLICLIPVTVVIWATNEAQGVAAFPRATDPGFQVALFWSAALAGLMNYLVFLSAAVNSPLTTSITGQAKNVVSSLGGYFLLPSSAGGGVGADKLVNIAGCSLGLLGSMWYAWQKFCERFPAQRPPPALASASDKAIHTARSGKK